LLNLGVTSHRLSHHPRIFLTKFSFESNLRIFSDLFLASLADLIASSQPSRATPIMTKQVPIFATESQVLSEAESKKSMAEYQRHESFRIVLTFWALGALFVLITLRIVVGIMLIMEKKKRAADS
jgi:beta-lactamase regulating signal transducer with metallopeptidase domain